jgi:hypothetical protein
MKPGATIRPLASILRPPPPTSRPIPDGSNPSFHQQQYPDISDKYSLIVV